jgi:hypothetical protein
LKLEKVFDISNLSLSEVYHPTEHSSICEIIVLFKEKVMFRQYIQANTNTDRPCGIKL